MKTFTSVNSVIEYIKLQWKNEQIPYKIIWKDSMTTIDGIYNQIQNQKGNKGILYFINPNLPEWFSFYNYEKVILNLKESNVHS